MPLSAYDQAACARSQAPTGLDTLVGREDARVAWRAENAKILDSREAEEKEANEGAKAKAAVRAPLALWLARRRSEARGQMHSSDSCGHAVAWGNRLGSDIDRSWMCAPALAICCARPRRSG